MAVAEGVVAALVRLIADPGRRRLTAVVLGSEQERALYAVTHEALRRTAMQISPGDPERAQQVQLVVGQVLGEPLRAWSPSTHGSIENAIRAGIAEQLAILDDQSVTGTGESAADVLGVSVEDIASTFGDSLISEIRARGSRGGPLAPLADQLNHDATHLQGSELRRMVDQIGQQLRTASRDEGRPALMTQNASSESPADIVLHIEQALEGLQLGDHDEAERRIHRLFIHLRRVEQQEIVRALLAMASAEPDHTTLLIICSLIEAASRLDPMLIFVTDVEALAFSPADSLRTTAAMIMWQWAEIAPGRVPVALLSRLALPSREDWYVHAPARAAAKQLLLRRQSARAVFDRMVSSRDADDRAYALEDLAAVARVDPRAVPADLISKLVKDQDVNVAERAELLRQSTKSISAAERRAFYGSFGL